MQWYGIWAPVFEGDPSYGMIVGHAWSEWVALSPAAAILVAGALAPTDFELRDYTGVPVGLQRSVFNLPSTADAPKATPPAWLGNLGGDISATA
ncbi:MAG TPA: hypothetical protein VM487_21055 [Phycisphaerae bacterium]|nr:hypothetical protein [Phycisphaerae bacterium]